MNVRREIARRHGWLQRVVSRAGQRVARPIVFVLLIAFHVGWIALNLCPVGLLEAWDPPPFMLLATIASVEAPILTLPILMRQEQDRAIAELREEVALQVALHTERECSSLLRRVATLKERLDIPMDREELEELEEPLHPKHLLQYLSEQLAQGEEKENPQAAPED